MGWVSMAVVLPCLPCGLVGRAPRTRSDLPLGKRCVQLLFLPRLAFLKDALELLALLLIEYLFHFSLAFAQHGAVVLPEIIEDGLHLLLLGRREVEFALHPGEIELPAHGSIEGRLVQVVMHAEIHSDG